MQLKEGLLILALVQAVFACTNILVSKGASADGSTQIAYNADSGNLYGSMSHYDGGVHATGSMRQIWDWDGSFYLGEIPEASETYTVNGNINEHGVMIGETTFGGLPQLDGHGTGAIMDYGSLIWVTLQRATSARDAIKIMDQLVQTYGYASDGESFSIGDPNEVWLMELIGKGKYEKGAVWVASKVPEGKICSHANQARTRTFNQTDPENVLFASDVVTFAQKVGLYPKDKPASEFSFSDIYDPVTFGGARLGEARVWNVYNEMTKMNGYMNPWLDYAQGYNLTNRMPLFITPSFKVTVNDTMWVMRTHFKDTWFDNQGVRRKDVGAGPGHSPYRWRPLEWSSGGHKYVNERTVGVQQTAWNFVATSRSWLETPFQALTWWSPDDSSTTLRIPIHGCATRIPTPFADPIGQEPAGATAYGPKSDAYHMSLDSAFWIWNLISNLAYGERFDEIFPLLQAKIIETETDLMTQVSKIEQEANNMYKAGEKQGAIEHVTKFAVQTGEQMHQEMTQFWMFLFARFRDGFTITPATQPQCTAGSHSNCTSRYVPITTESGYNSDWYDRIVADGDNSQHYHVPNSIDLESPLEQHKLRRMNKQRI